VSLGKLRIAAAGALGTLAFAAHAAPTGAATIGQLASTTFDPPLASCTASDLDRVQPTVLPGVNSFVVPPFGARITSWSHSAAAPALQLLTFKVYRKVAEPATYMAVAHDGPRLLDPAVINKFTTDIAVQPGDVIGLNSGNAGTINNACVEVVGGGEAHLTKASGAPGLADGQSDAFSNSPNSRVNVTAEVIPDATFILGKAKPNKKKGTATLSVEVPGPGELALSGKTVKAAGARSSIAATGAGTVQLKVRPRGKAKRKLSDQGKVKVTANITFTPSALGGAPPSSQTKKLKLRKT
jgi:hypothetical protein